MGLNSFFFSIRASNFILHKYRSIHVKDEDRGITNRQILGSWKSGTPSLDALTLIDGSFTADGNRGRWSATDRDIWLLNSDGKTGTKWSFTLEKADALIFHDPEDFTYMGHGEYVYFQMTPPSTSISFHRVKET